MVITPETGYDELEVLENLRYLGEAVKKNHAIVIVTEKICDVDQLARKISQNTGFSGRATVLGHIQRGGSPTPKDRMLASQMRRYIASRRSAGLLVIAFAGGG